MVPAWRRDRLLRHLRDRGAATVAELAAVIGASESTARRDVEALAAQGALVRTPGGVMAPDRPPSTFEPSSAEAARAAVAQKAAIGREAAARIEPAQCVFFDTGTTVRAAATAAVRRRIAFTALTNDLQTAIVLTGEPSVTLIVTGGTLRAGSFSLLGAPGLDFLRGLHPDLALIGAHGVDGGVVTETSVELAEVKIAAIRRARRCILLADASKFRTRALRTVAPLSAFAEIISDPGLDPAEASSLRAAGATVTQARAEA